MNLDELQWQLHAGRVQPLYAIVGDNLPARRQALLLLRNHICPGDLATWNYQDIDGSQTPGSAIATQAGTPGFLGDRRLLVVNDYQSMPATEQEALLAALPTPVSVVVLVAASIDKRTKAGQTLGKKAAVVEVAEPEVTDLAPWVVAQAAQVGLKMPRPVAQTMIDIAGTDTGFLAQEVVKLATYLGGQTSVTEETVMAVVARGESEPAQFAVFRLTEAIVDGKAPTALEQLAELLTAGEPPLRILAMIARQYRMLLGAKAWQAEGANGIAKALNLKPYPAQKLLEQARRLSLDQIYQGLELILETDLALKMGGDSGTLQVLVVSLAEAAKGLGQK